MSEENNINIILTKEEAQEKFNKFMKNRNDEVSITFKKIFIEPYIDKNTGKLSEKLSQETRDFLLKDNGMGVIPANIPGELTEFRNKN